MCQAHPSRFPGMDVQIATVVCMRNLRLKPPIKVLVRKCITMPFRSLACKTVRTLLTGGQFAVLASSGKSLL